MKSFKKEEPSHIQGRRTIRTTADLKTEGHGMMYFEFYKTVIFQPRLLRTI